LCFSQTADQNDRKQRGANDPDSKKALPEIHYPPQKWAILRLLLVEEHPVVTL
jgi:hypothetical protein